MTCFVFLNYDTTIIYHFLLQNQVPQIVLLFRSKQRLPAFIYIAAAGMLLAANCVVFVDH